MGFLDNIVTEINNVVKNHLTAFPTAEYFGIAYVIPKKEGKDSSYLPAIIDINGEAKWMTFDDVRELSIYHRMVSSTYNMQKQKTYGDGHDYVQQNYDMDMVIMSDRKKICIQPDVLEMAIGSNIPSVVKLETIEPANIISVSANHSAKSVFGNEFTGIEYYLKPEHILFSIRYRVELRYLKGCISLCHCD